MNDKTKKAANWLFGTDSYTPYPEVEEHEENPPALFSAESRERKNAIEAEQNERVKAASAYYQDLASGELARQKVRAKYKVMSIVWKIAAAMLIIGDLFALFKWLPNVNGILKILSETPAESFAIMPTAPFLAVIIKMLIYFVICVFTFGAFGAYTIGVKLEEAAQK